MTPTAQLIASLACAILAGLCAVLASESDGVGLFTYRRAFTLAGAFLLVAAAWLLFPALAA